MSLPAYRPRQHPSPLIHRRRPKASLGIAAMDRHARAGLPWSMSVAAEVVVFLFIGRPLLDRIGAAHAAMLAAAAGIRAA